MKKLLYLAIIGTLFSCQNKPPTCEILKPTADTVFLHDDKIIISIAADDPDGTITEVRVSLDGEGLISMKDWPYKYEISAKNYSHSKHLIEATAYDDEREEASDETSFEIGALPVIETLPASQVEPKQAVVGGSISAGTLPFEKGIYYGTSQDLADTGSFRQSLDDLTTFEVRLANLEPGTQYFYQAYVSNKYGSSIGAQMTFTTLTQSLPVVSTSSVHSIAYMSAVCGGSIQSDGRSEIIEKGVCWSTEPSPDINDDRTTDGTGTSAYISYVRELTPGTSYYLRAYATNELGTGYGEQQIFRTKSYDIPTLSTSQAVSITESSAICGGNVSADGGQEVSERGICWSTDPNPTIDDNYLADDGSGIGEFTVEMTDLASSEEYHVKAYAKNSVGVSYGNEVVFNTLGTPTVLTSIPYSVSQTSAIFGGKLVLDGGTAITERGFYYGASPDPVSSGEKVPIDPVNGNFSIEIDGLVIGNTYYLMAFAANSSGSGYGEEIQYTHTDPEDIVQDIDGNYYQIVEIGSQWWMAENLSTTTYNDGTEIPQLTEKNLWQNTNQGAYCWYDNDELTNKNLYGAIYNYYAVNTSKLCPTGWHVPSDNEWKSLEGYLGMSTSEQERYNDFRGTDEGGKLKDVGTEYWESPNSSATNESGFTALPGGSRDNEGDFAGMSNYIIFWTSTEHTSSVSWYRILSYRYAGIGRTGTYNYRGLYVRCVKD